MDTNTLLCMHHVDCGCKTCMELCDNMPLFEWFKWHEVPSPSLPSQKPYGMSSYKLNDKPTIEDALESSSLSDLSQSQ